MKEGKISRSDVLRKSSPLGATAVLGPGLLDGCGSDLLAGRN